MAMESAVLAAPQLACLAACGWRLPRPLPPRAPGCAAHSARAKLGRPRWEGGGNGRLRRPPPGLCCANGIDPAPPHAGAGLARRGQRLARAAHGHGPLPPRLRHTGGRARRRQPRRLRRVLRGVAHRDHGHPDAADRGGRGARLGRRDRDLVAAACVGRRLPAAPLRARPPPVGRAAAALAADAARWPGEGQGSGSG